MLEEKEHLTITLKELEWENLNVAQRQHSIENPLTDECDQFCHQFE